jgi:hypothetical protein
MSGCEADLTQGFPCPSILSSGTPLFFSSSSSPKGIKDLSDESSEPTLRSQVVREIHFSKFNLSDPSRDAEDIIKPARQAEELRCPRHA